MQHRGCSVARGAKRCAEVFVCEYNSEYASNHQARDNKHSIGGFPGGELCTKSVCLCVQVAKELGIPYEDQEFLLEPDHGDWAENIAFAMGKDAADLGRYPAVMLLVVLCAP